MPILLKNFKTYIVIDYLHEIYGFVNSPSDLDKFYADNNIDISTLPRDGDSVLTDAVLVKIKTKEEFPIKYSYGSTLCI
jgi:hypothetical protein